MRERESVAADVGIPIRLRRCFRAGRSNRGGTEHIDVYTLSSGRKEVMHTCRCFFGQETGWWCIYRYMHAKHLSVYAGGLYLYMLASTGICRSIYVYAGWRGLSVVSAS